MFLSRDIVWKYLLPIALWILISFVYFSASLPAFPHFPSRKPAPASSDPFHEEDTKWTSNVAFQHLTDLCNKTEWHQGAWLHCHSDCGENSTSICMGLNNARSRVQTCLRLAIDAGFGLILPSATIRDPDHLERVDGDAVPLAEYWNTKYLQSSMNKVCPQLEIRESDDRSGIQNVIEAKRRGFQTDLKQHTNGTFRQLMVTTFEDSDFGLNTTTLSNRTVVSWGDALFAWDYHTAGETSTIKKALFQMIKYNQDLLDISSRVLKSPELNHGNFIGVHLRGERDWPDSFGNKSLQMDLYSNEIARLQETMIPSQQIRTIYVSCGDPEPIQSFRDRLEPLGYTVVDKWAILSDHPDLFAKLNSLAFDQKGIVEYRMLIAAKVFLGIITSTMSDLVAYARSVKAAQEEDFFETYINPGTERISAVQRNFPDGAKMRGDNSTQLLVLTGMDVMDLFP